MMSHTRFAAINELWCLLTSIQFGTSLSTAPRHSVTTLYCMYQLQSNFNAWNVHTCILMRQSYGLVAAAINNNKDLANLHVRIKSQIKDWQRLQCKPFQLEAHLDGKNHLCNRYGRVPTPDAGRFQIVCEHLITCWPAYFKHKYFCETLFFSFFLSFWRRVFFFSFPPSCFLCDPSSDVNAPKRLRQGLELVQGVRHELALDVACYRDTLWRVKQASCHKQQLLVLQGYWICKAWKPSMDAMHELRDPGAKCRS